jgi:hypothetical protein
MIHKKKKAPGKKGFLGGMYAKPKK